MLYLVSSKILSCLSNEDYLHTPDFHFSYSSHFSLYSQFTPVTAVVKNAMFLPLSFSFDTVQYNQTVEDREAQIANITEDIRNGNTGYLNDFLNALISDSIREGMTDIIGKGTELDDSEGVQTARKAKELLDKLAEYKPLAKIEELEECNYNMIDNVLNNEKPKEEKQAGRISIKEKLAEKKAVIEQRDKSDKEVPEKGTEKKSEREI